LETQRFYACNVHASIDNIGETVRDILDYFNVVYGKLDEAVYFELKVVINELLSNAIKHGCKENEDKFVRVLAGIVDKEFALLKVEDDGDGYDTTILEQYGKTGETVIKNVDDINEYGRGIFLVKNLCDEFKINRKGNKVVINKRLSKAKTGMKARKII